MDRKIKYFNYPLLFKGYEKEYLNIINDTLSRGAYILGEDLKTFEDNLANFLGCKFAIGISNCTDAMLLSLIAAGLEPGNEVISVSHTFVATIEVITFLRAKPVFVDIADDHNMDVDLVEAAVTPRTKAIMPVHLNGTITKNMSKLLNIAKKHNLIIIEDAAQSLGAKYKGKSAGTFGLAGCFSFYPAKLLGAFGDAGAIVTDNPEFAEKIKMLRNHGLGKDSDINLWGLNCRMDNLHAAVLNFKLNKLPDWIVRRRNIAKMYYDKLSEIKGLKLPLPPEDRGEYYDVFQNFEIEAERRDSLVNYLNEKGIETMLSWGGKGVHQLKVLEINNYTLPRTEELFKKILMIPMYPELLDNQIEYICNSIQKFYGAK